MRKLEASDRAVIRASEQTVFAAILDVSSYRRWWPAFLVLKVLSRTESGLGSSLRVRPFLGPGYDYHVVSYKECHEIRVRYGSGLFEGDGVWRVKRLSPPSEPPTVEVSYDVDLKLTHPLTKFAARFVNLGDIHSWNMKSVFQSLEKVSRASSKFVSSSNDTNTRPPQTPEL